MTALILAIALGTSLKSEVARAACYDGDTCTMDWLIASHTDESIGVRTTTLIEAVARTVRLCDINAPELKGTTAADGAKARDALLEWILHARLLEWQPSRDKDGKERKDSFGRWLGWLYADGVELNAKLVSEGFAVPFSERCPR